jgi:GTPase Era involved in 16S rRNA processing
MKNVSFSDIAIVSCGTLSLELNHLKKEGFLDTSHLFFTTPGLHEDIHELEAQLIQRISKAKERVDKVLVVYGGKFCYVNVDEPTRTMQKIIEEQGSGVSRIQATVT